MGYWSHIIQFHESALLNHPEAKRGILCVRYLRSVLEPGWHEDSTAQHPLRNNLGWAGADNYKWLGQLARKLNAASSLSGFSSVLRRLSHADEYHAAMAEVETALRFSLAGFKVTFVPPAQDASPDLTVREGDSEFSVEVASLNPPDEQRRLDDLFHAIHSITVFKVVAGGHLSRPPRQDEVELVVGRVREAVRQALETNEVIMVNVPGLATIYLAPRELAASMPEDCRGHFRLVPPYPRPLAERIGRQIRNKAKQTFAGGNPGVLHVYGTMMGHEDARALFEDPLDDVSVVLASLPQLAVLALTSHVQWRDSESIEWQESGNRAFLCGPTSIFESEATVTWTNSHVEGEIPFMVVRAFRDYSANLDSFLQAETL